MIGQSAQTIATELGNETYLGRAAMYLCRIHQETAILTAIEGNITRWTWKTPNATRRLTVPPQPPKEEQ